RFILDGIGILNGQANRASRGVSTGLLAGAPAPDNRQIDADGLQALLLVPAESLAQPDQQNDRSDSPDDPEHSKEAAQFVRRDGSGGLPNHFPDIQELKSLRCLDGLERLTEAYPPLDLRMGRILPLVWRLGLEE